MPSKRTATALLRSHLVGLKAWEMRLEALIATLHKWTGGIATISIVL